MPERRISQFENGLTFDKGILVFFVVSLPHTLRFSAMPQRHRNRSAAEKGLRSSRNSLSTQSKTYWLMVQ